MDNNSVVWTEPYLQMEKNWDNITYSSGHHATVGREQTIPYSPGGSGKCVHSIHQEFPPDRHTLLQIYQVECIIFHFCGTYGTYGQFLDMPGLAMRLGTIACSRKAIQTRYHTHRTNLLVMWSEWQNCSVNTRAVFWQFRPEYLFRTGRILLSVKSIVTIVCHFPSIEKSKKLSSYWWLLWNNVC